MNQFTIYIDKDLTPRWNEFPKYTDFEESSLGHYTQYDAALQKAKEEAIPFEDSKVIFALMLDQDKYKWSADPDSFVTIDYDGTIERRLVWDSKKLCSIEVARLIPSKPKEVNSAHSYTEGSEETCIKPNCDCANKFAESKGIDVYAIKGGYPCLKSSSQLKKINPAAEKLMHEIADLNFKKFTLYDESIRTVAGTGTTPFSTPEKPDNSKPDFEAMAQAAWDDHFEDSDFTPEQKEKHFVSKLDAFLSGGGITSEKLYSDIYLPTLKESETWKVGYAGLQKQLNDQCILGADYIRQIQELRDKIKTLEEENETLKAGH